MKQKPGMVTQILGDDDLMVVPTEGDNVNKVLTLNGSGGFVWGLLESDRSLEELVGLVMAEYGLSADEARADLNEFLYIIKDYIE